MTRLGWVIILAFGCGDGGGSTPPADAADPDTMQGALVPDPGTVEGGEWTDAEPNDTPDRATPVGILNGPVWAGFVEPYTQIDSATDVDFFVFKTKDAASLANDFIQICWAGGIDLLDLFLYQVVDQRQGPEIRAAQTTDTGCETILAFGEGPMVLAPDTVYLLEVRAAQGLDPAGLPALYGA